MLYSFNHSLYIHPLDAASDQALVLCEVPAQKGSTLRFALPADLLELLKMFDGDKEVAEVVADYDRLNPGKYSLKKIESLVQSFLLPKRLLVDHNAPEFLPEVSARRASYIYAKVRLIPREIVYPVAKLFGWAFQKWVLKLWLALFVIGHVIFYLWIFPQHPMRLHHFTGSTFSTVMLLSLLGAFIHELGHASALVSNGCKQTEIGFGMYIYYPVLYTDVSEAWKLPRQQRALIDIGGVYFQSVFQLLLLGLYFTNGSTTLLYFFLFNDFIMFRTMNPFLRMDGYWLVADLFGIFNLRQQSTNVIRYYVLKLFRSARAGNTPLQNLKPGARIALAVYSLLATVFFFYICAIMIRISIFYLIPTYPTRAIAVLHVLQTRPFDVIKLFSLLFEMLWRTAVLCGLSLFAYRLVKGVWGLVKFLVHTLFQRLFQRMRSVPPAVAGG
jgi:putative peptide zinc metalloprotease protein